MKNNIKVSVCIVTYNQQDYIAQAIESVLMQQTDFPYEIVIGEDVSTDDTRRICLEYQTNYPEVIKVLLHDTNKGLIGNFVSTVQASSSEYIALCDGDDYWIDPLKLQKQIELLDKNKDYGFVHTNKKMLKDGVVYEGKPSHIENSIEELLLYNFINVPTVIFRKSVVEDFITNFVQLASERNWKMQDYPLWLHIALSHKFAYIEEETSMYRVLSNTLSRPQNKEKAYQFDKCVMDVRMYFYFQYLESKQINTFFKNRFNEMIFHARKRMILDYGWIASEQIGYLFTINPMFYFYLIISKVRRKLN